MAKLTKIMGAANFQQYAETVNENDELVLSGKDKDSNKDFFQILKVDPPCLVLYDVSNYNFYTIPLHSEYNNPNLRLVKLVASVEE